METVDIVVVGAGIIGSPIVCQLARRTSDRVKVLDKGAGPLEGDREPLTHQGVLA